MSELDDKINLHFAGLVVRKVRIPVINSTQSSNASIQTSEHEH